jgi:hypothetical protein
MDFYKQALKTLPPNYRENPRWLEVKVKFDYQDLNMRSRVISISLGELKSNALDELLEKIPTGATAFEEYRCIGKALKEDPFFFNKPFKIMSALQFLHQFKHN